MERKSKSRLLIGGLIIFSALITVYTYWVFLKSDNPTQDWQAFLLNVSTELIGTLIVFFFFNLFFFLDDWDLSERVTKLLHKLERERPTAEKYFHKMPEIGPLIQESQAIDLCGVSLTSTINRQFTLLRDGLIEGKNIRLLIIDPRSTAIEMANARSESRDLSYYEKRLDSSLSGISYLNEKWKYLKENGRTGSLKVRLMPYAPSFGIQIFQNARMKGKILVEIYPHHSGYGTPPVFSLDESDDSNWFKYYKSQFEEMWEQSRVWNPGEDKDPLDFLQSSSRVTADDFLMQVIPAYQNRVEKAKKVYLYGDTLQNTINRNFSAFHKVLVSGGQIKIILSNLDAGIVENSGSLRRDSLHALSRLQSSPQNTGNIEVREFNKPRLFSIHVIDPDYEFGRIFIRLDSPMTAYKPRPKFELLKNRDSYWFNYFLEQWDKIWEASQPVDLIVQLESSQLMGQDQDNQETSS